MTRTDAIERTLALLRSFWTSPQGTAPDMTGHKGFYYQSPANGELCGVDLQLSVEEH